MSGDVAMFLADVKERLEWPTVWTRLHQLYPVNNRLIRSYVFPLMQVASALTEGFKVPYNFLLAHLEKCAVAVEKELLEYAEKSMSQSEYHALSAIIGDSIEQGKGGGSSVYGRIANVAADLSAFLAYAKRDAASDASDAVDAASNDVSLAELSGDQKAIERARAAKVARDEIYNKLRSDNQPLAPMPDIYEKLAMRPEGHYIAWDSVIRRLPGFYDGTLIRDELRLAINPPGSFKIHMTNEESVKVYRQSVLYISRIEDCFQRTVIDQNQLNVPEILWRRIQDIELRQYQILNPPPVPPPPPPPPPFEPAIAAPPFFPPFVYPPAKPALSIFGRPVVPLSLRADFKQPTIAVPREGNVNPAPMQMTLRSQRVNVNPAPMHMINPAPMQMTLRSRRRAGSGVPTTKPHIPRHYFALLAPRFFSRPPFYCQ